MLKVAVYGKGGIGKSTVTSNLAAAFAAMGKRVIQIGCDPKADSTINLLGGEPLRPVMNYMREEDEEPEKLEDISKEGFGGVLCIETGGPTPGLGCAGRGIIATFQLLEYLKLFETWKPDVVLYDVLGDVTRKLPQGQGFSTISVPMTSRRRLRPVSIRRFITRRLPQTTVPHTLMSQTKSWMRYSHICSLWDLFHATGKPGSSALPIKPAPSRKAAISPLHWPGGTGSSSIRHNFHTKNRAVSTSDEPCFCVEIYFMVILCRLLSIS